VFDGCRQCHVIDPQLERVAGERGEIAGSVGADQTRVTGR
jgi:hypothetical protein